MVKKKYNDKIKKSVLASIKPKYCELIASGKKTAEIRKNRPKIDVPFKCYIYCTRNELLTKSHNTGQIYVATDKKYQTALEKRGNVTLSDKVIGEFICDRIDVIDVIEMYGSFSHIHEADMCLNEKSCLSNDEIDMYLQDKQGYAWHISDLQIYDKPKELSEFGLTRPPQSWCYVEELEG